MIITIYWHTRNRKAIYKIRERFNISNGMTLNGETTCTINDEDLELLREVERKGYVQIRNKIQNL
ncbi:MAG: hypothetical protein RR386_06490 [Bacteroidaceae bacterium]